VCYHNAIKKHRVEKGKDNHISEKAKIKYPYSAKEERERKKNAERGLRRIGLELADRKELEKLLKVAANDPKVATTLAGKMVPSQGDVKEFAYGLLVGMVIGNFMAAFEIKNGRQPDRDETADTLSIMMARMPTLRKSIMKQLEIR
jgi:hypothetical protein